MKKRIFSALTALALSLSIIPSAFASEDTTTTIEQNQYVTVNNAEQLSLNPYEKTSVTTCYSYYSTLSTFGFSGGATSNGYSPTYLVFKGVDFGELGASSVSLEYAHKYARTGSITFYTATANADGTYTEGTKIATLTGFDATGAYNSTKTLTKTVNITADITGTHDIMIKLGSKNYVPNIVSFTFSEYDPFGDDNELNFVYLGGSITQGSGASDASSTSWRALTSAYLSEKFAKEGRTINHYNAAIGGTGSDFGLSISLESKVMSKNPDMVFIEYVVNDAGKQDGLWQMESIVKTLNNMENPPYIMFIYTVVGTVTKYTTKYHKQVAEHYGIPAVDLQSIIKADMADDTFIGDPANEVTDWGASMTADNIHPNDAGYAYFAKYINEALSKGSAYKKATAKETQVSEYSRIVDIEKVPVTDYIVSGTEGTDWAIKEVSGKNLLYLYTPGTTVTATIKGDLVGFEDYIHKTGGYYNVAIDGRVLSAEPRDTYNSVFTVGGPKVNMGYFNMKMPWKDERTVTLTMLEEKNSKVTGSPVVVIGPLSYNVLKNEAPVVETTGVDPYEGILATNENIVLESNQKVSGGLIQNMKAGEAFSINNINFNKGASKVKLEFASNASSSLANGELKLYLGTSTSGTLLATIPVEPNGSWTSTTTVEVDTNVNPYGTYTLYCKSKGGVATFNVKSLTFTDGTGLAADLDTTLNYNYIAEASEDTTLYGGVYDDLGTGDYLKFVVDFGEAHTKDLVEVAAAAKNSTGNIVLREGSIDGEIIATVDASEYTTWASYNTALAPLTDYAKTLTGEHDIYVTFEGEDGFCMFKSIAFGEALDADEIVLDSSNYSGKGGDTSQFSINSTSGCFQGFNKEQYVYWNNVDFGSESKLRNLTVGYGLGTTGANCYVTVRLDSASGKIIAQGIMKWISGIGWNTPKYLTVPVTEEVTGIHDIYVSVEYDDAEGYRYGTRGGNIFGLDFAPVEGNYLTSYNTYGDYARTSKAPVDMKTVLTFLKDETTPANVAFVTAVYNSDNVLVGVDYTDKAVTDGVNSLTSKISYSVIGNDDYKVKGYIWDSETIKPVVEDVELAAIANTTTEEVTE